MFRTVVGVLRTVTQCLVSFQANVVQPSSLKTLTPPGPHAHSFSCPACRSRDPNAGRRELRDVRAPEISPHPSARNLTVARGAEQK